jgi:hypothetical protein
MTNKVVAMFLGVASLAVIHLRAGDNEEPIARSSPGTNAPMFAKLPDAKLNPILPDLDADSPQICILHVASKKNQN